KFVLQWVDRSSLDPARKWAAGPAASASHRTGRIALTSRLGDFATCSRGIATGANDYFTLTREEACRWQLPESVLRPCVTKAAQVRGNVWTDEQMRELIAAGKRTLILDVANHADDPAVRRYLEHGEQREIHRRYLTRHRRPWYALERRAPADLWVTTFGRGR